MHSHNSIAFAVLEKISGGIRVRGRELSQVCKYMTVRYMHVRIHVHVCHSPGAHCV